MTHEKHIRWVTRILITWFIVLILMFFLAPFAVAQEEWIHEGEMPFKWYIEEETGDVMINFLPKKRYINEARTVAFKSDFFLPFLAGNDYFSYEVSRPLQWKEEAFKMMTEEQYEQWYQQSEPIFIEFRDADGLLVFIYKINSTGEFDPYIEFMIYQ